MSPRDSLSGHANGHTLQPSSNGPSESASLLFSADDEHDDAAPHSPSPPPPPPPKDSPPSYFPRMPPPHPSLDPVTGLPLASSPSPAHDSNSTTTTTNPRRGPARRQSSLSKPPPPGAPRTPRTSNRVRFDSSAPQVLGSPPLPPSPLSERNYTGWGEDLEYTDEDDYDLQGGRRNSDGGGGGQTMRLLEGIEAPSVRVANSLDMGDEDRLDGLVRGREGAKSGMRSAFMNMANSIIGAGIIGQPYAFKQAGLLAGVLLLVGLTVTVDWTIRLIVVNSKLSGANSFQATMEHCFGKPGLIAISLAQWAFAFGGMLAFCVIVGDTIPHVMSAIIPGLEDINVLWLLGDRRFVIVLFVLGVSFPLSLYRDIAKLAKASTLALISMLVIIVTVITQGVRVDAEHKGALKGNLLVNSGIFQAIGVISFAFVCHHNSLLIYGSLQTPTMDRFAKVTHFSTGVSMLACLTMALSGFLTFGDKTEGNVLNNFPTDNLMVNIARLCFGLNMLTTLPLEAFVCREVMTTYFHPRSPHSTPRHVIYTVGLVFSSVFLSLLTCDLGAVFELIGATSACALAYIMPPLCYIKLSSRSWRTGVAWAVVAFGVGVLIVSTVLAVKNLVSGGEGKQCK